jgi:hypothetical protein
MITVNNRFSRTTLNHSHYQRIETGANSSQDDNVVVGDSFSQLPDYHELATSSDKRNRQNLFQSPSRSTFSMRRSRQSHVNSKSAPSSISCRSLLTNIVKNSSSKKEDEQIFESIPAGLQIQRRHLQKMRKTPLKFKSLEEPIKCVT